MKLNAAILTVLGMISVVISSNCFAETSTVYTQTGTVGDGAEKHVINESFTVTDSGHYQVILTDFSESVSAPEYLAPYEQLSTIIMSDTDAVCYPLTGPGQSEPFYMEAGEYQIYLAGKPTLTSGKVSQFGVDVVAYNTSAESPYSKVGFLEQEVITTSNETIDNGFLNIIGVDESGTYKVYLTNFNFPEKLTTLMLQVPDPEEPSVLLMLNASSDAVATGTFEAEAGERYRLATIAIPGAETGKGLFGLKVARVAGDEEITVLEKVVTVGGEEGDVEAELFQIHEDQFNVETSGMYQLSLVDFTLQLSDYASLYENSGELFDMEAISEVNMLIQGPSGEALYSFNGINDDVTIQLEPGMHTIRLLSDKQVNENGMYGIKIWLDRQFTTDLVVYEYTGVLGDDFIAQYSPENLEGDYQLLLTDFQYRKLFSELDVVVTSGTRLVHVSQVDYQATVSGYSNGPLTTEGVLNALESNQYQIFVFAKEPQADGSGVVWPALFGLQLYQTQEDSQELVFERNGTLGGGFYTEGLQLTVEDAGDYTVTLWDFEFPEAFNNLNLAVTHDQERMLVIYQTDINGEGKYTFEDLQPGNYFVNLIADPSNDFQLATYSLMIQYDPAAVEEPITGDGDEDTGGSGGGGALSLLLLIGLLNICFLRKISEKV